MGFRFGDFELDVTARALKRDGQEQPLQPLVFDLLVYLIQHRDRVVSKDELLSTLWKDVTVTDGSLQRAVSLLRGVLRDGGLPDAVQTFARRGYRWSGGTTPPAASPAAASDGRALVVAGHWDRALAAFAAADPATLAAEDWEAWGQAAICAAQLQDAVVPFERAVVAFEEHHDPEGAARVALLLTNVKIEMGELAIAKGWHGRARAHLTELSECKSHGMADWLSARFALFEGRLDDCAAQARAALEVAKRVGDPDVRCLGYVYLGHVLIAQGAIKEGLSLHDEAGVAALAGKVGPWVSGIVLCSVIWVYLHLGDHHRAGQWTDEFSRWCERYPAYAFPALCRLHRGEVLAARGDLASAEQEVSQARNQLSLAGPYCEGDACRVLGEIRLSRGDLDAAETAFRDAYRLGWNPQPGLAELLAARGHVDVALKQLDNALAHPGWTDGQRRRILLAVLARIAAMNGQLDRAMAAVAALAALPPESQSPASAAETARAQAELAWAEGNAPRAEILLRQAIQGCFDASAPVRAAHVRLRLAALLLETGDVVAADFELGAAEAVFRDVHASPMVKACQHLRRRATG